MRMPLWELFDVGAFEKAPSLTPPSQNQQSCCWVEHRHGHGATKLRCDSPTELTHTPILNQVTTRLGFGGGGVMEEVTKESTLSKIAFMLEPAPASWSETPVFRSQDTPTGGWHTHLLFPGFKSFRSLVKKASQESDPHFRFCLEVPFSGNLCFLQNSFYVASSDIREHVSM